MREMSERTRETYSVWLELQLKLTTLTGGHDVVYGTQRALDADLAAHGLPSDPTEAILVAEYWSMLTAMTIRQADAVGLCW